MAHRYAVLWEPTEGRARPAGIVVEQDGSVLVEVRADLALPVRYDQPFVVTGPDMLPVTYRPGRAGYFDQVILDLSRSFIINNEGSVSDATPGVVLTLLRKWVFEPLRHEHAALYCDTAGSFPTVRAYQDRYYRYEPDAVAKPSPPPRSPVGVSRLVAA